MNKIIQWIKLNKDGAILGALVGFAYYMAFFSFVFLFGKLSYFEYISQLMKVMLDFGMTTMTTNGWYLSGLAFVVFGALVGLVVDSFWPNKQPFTSRLVGIGAIAGALAPFYFTIVGFFVQSMSSSYGNIFTWKVYAAMALGGAAIGFVYNYLGHKLGKWGWLAAFLGTLLFIALLAPFVGQFYYTTFLGNLDLFSTTSIQLSTFAGGLVN